MGSVIVRPLAPRCRCEAIHQLDPADILEPTNKTIDALMRLDLPSGVDIEIKSA